MTKYDSTPKMPIVASVSASSANVPIRTARSRGCATASNARAETGWASIIGIAGSSADRRARTSGTITDEGKAPVTTTAIPRAHLVMNPGSSCE